MYQIGVCDDDEIVREQVLRLLSGHPDCGKFRISVYRSGEELLESMEDGQRFDLLILDISLGVRSGVEIGRYIRETLRDNRVQILYISASTRHVLKLFDVRPLNFLIKPLNEKKLLDCVTKALELSSGREEMLTIHPSKQIWRIPLWEIRYLESYNRRLTIHTIHEDVVCGQKLDEVMRELPYPEFFRIQHSFAVNAGHVRRIQYDKLVLDDGTELSISQAYRKQVKDLMCRPAMGCRPQQA